MAWMLGSSPTSPGAVSPRPGDAWAPLQRHPTGPGAIVRSADTAQRFSFLRGKTGLGGAGRPRAPAVGGMSIKLPKFRICTIKSKPVAFPRGRCQAESFAVF